MSGLSNTLYGKDCLRSLTLLCCTPLPGDASAGRTLNSRSRKQNGKSANSKTRACPVPTGFFQMGCRTHSCVPVSRKRLDLFTDRRVIGSKRLHSS